MVKITVNIIVNIYSPNKTQTEDAEQNKHTGQSQSWTISQTISLGRTPQSNRDRAGHLHALSHDWRALPDLVLGDTDYTTTTTYRYRDTFVDTTHVAKPFNTLFS